MCNTGYSFTVLCIVLGNKEYILSVLSKQLGSAEGRSSTMDVCLGSVEFVVLCVFGGCVEYS